MVGGIQLNSILLQMLRFADDIAVVAKSEEDLGNILTKKNKKKK